ncbi:MAG: hypothetical protein HY852_06560 [Bradyrhizobium sp.]|uniref:hypothetical protein n=1 Tax=Bradyrhizobium sp. TaxID=376 RepID=UPI0025BAF1AF|nr:hypothetical protein [Bradyrhizobium sp.]MBI5261464.1 hypothetical protein [Bradyrhizobium sp.]
MRASMAYFAGAGTIVAAIAVGLGGGLIAGNIMNPQLPKEASAATRLERGAPVDTVGASTTPARAAAERTILASDPVPYLAETQRAGFGAAFERQAHSTQAPARASATNDGKNNGKNDGKPADASSAPTARTAEQPGWGEKAGSPEDAYARANYSDLRREAAERRRAERRQRWAERHRRDWREPTDWGDVDRRVREDAEARDNGARRAYGFPQIRLFANDDE